MEIIRGLKQIVGDQFVITDKQKTAPYTEELRGRYTSACRAVVLPESAAQISALLGFCNDNKVTVVPQGGNTGAMGGAVANKDQIIINTKRLDKIIDIDPVNNTMTVQAGCILANIQESAKLQDRLFPLSLGAQGTCQIGGNLATNAGGINVLHYGNTRDLVLGIEVVLANGEIMNGLNSLRKNNTGYDLKHLFIGSEGTLGIITAAVLKLFPYPKGQVVSLIGLDSVAAGLKLFDQLKSTSSDRITTFELMSQIAVETAVKHIHGQSNPFEEDYPWYILAVINSSRDDENLRSQIETALGTALENKIICNAVVAQNQSQGSKLILLREDIVEAQKFIGGSIKHDVSVPVVKVPEFMDHARQAILDYMPTAIPYPYGHLGDGNIHYNISQPADMEKAEFLDNWKAINTVMHDICHQYQGSFSAEHGIGISKLDEMEKYKDPVELRLYRKLKNMLDPEGILNPGKVIR